MKLIKNIILAGTLACTLVACAAGNVYKNERVPSPLIADTVESPEVMPVEYSGKNVSYYYTEGIKRLNIYNDNEGALRMFQMAIGMDSTHSPSYFEAANSLVFLEPLRALEYSRKANEIDTTDIWYKSQYGRLMVINGQYEGASKIYEDLIKIAPRNPENYSMLAALYEFTKQPFSAIGVLDKAEKLMGKNEQLAAYKRELLVKVGLYDRAIEEAKELVAAYPYNYENYLALGQLYAEKGKDSLAMENFKMASSMNPGALDVVATLNEYYKQTNDNVNFLVTAKQLVQSSELPLEAKIKIYNDITSNRNFYRDHYFQIKDLAAALYVQYPREYEAIKVYGDNLIAYGDLEDALQMYKDYVRDTITDIQPFKDILDIEAYLQRSDSINKYAAVALKHFPANTELYIRQGGALQYIKDYKGAVKTFEQALKYAETDSVKSVVLGIIGDTYHSMGNDKKSYSYYDKSLQLWPDNVTVLNNFAYYLSLENRELEKALQMAQRVMELNPGKATFIDTYGWVLYKLQRYEEAKTYIRQAIALDTDNSMELLVHYGDILYALGDVYMAEIYWKRALEAGYDASEIEERIESSRK